MTAASTHVSLAPNMCDSVDNIVDFILTLHSHLKLFLKKHINISEPHLHHENSKGRQRRDVHL